MSELSKRQSSQDERSGDKGLDVRPIPDPTVLTTQQLLREVSSVREILESRLNGMDKAIALIQSQVDRSPSIAEIYAEMGEKFNSVQTQFKERDTRTEQTSKDSKVAVDAALQAAKEAVGEQNKSSSLAIAKSETATTKQIDSITAIIQSNQKATDDKITDVKDRMGAIETRIQASVVGIEQRHMGGTEVLAYVVGAIGFIGLLVAVGTMFVMLHK